MVGKHGGTCKKLLLPFVMGVFVWTAGCSGGTGTAADSACTPDCEGKQCGEDDGCGGRCTACPENATCSAETWECVCPGQWCGSDCCLPGQTCSEGGQCVGQCEPNCEGRECGPDQCGGTCGQCGPDETCKDGKCVACAGAPCPAGEYCDPGTGKCVEGCGSDDDCKPKERCDPLTHQCKCKSPLVRCGSECVDTQSDPTNCGSCGAICSDGLVCAGGKCESGPDDCNTTGCPQGYYCDLATGQCNPGCGKDADCGENEKCDAETHECVCKDGFFVCGGQCKSEADYHVCSGKCYPKDSVLACGDKCEVCKDVPNGEAACVNGKCWINCDEGYHYCQGNCVANDSTQHCGTNCNPCWQVMDIPDEAEEACDGVQCYYVCADGNFPIGYGYGCRNWSIGSTKDTRDVDDNSGTYISWVSSGLIVVYGVELSWAETYVGWAFYDTGDETWYHGELTDPSFAEPLYGRIAASMEEGEALRAVYQVAGKDELRYVMKDPFWANKPMEDMVVVSGSEFGGVFDMSTARVSSFKYMVHVAYSSGDGGAKYARLKPSDEAFEYEVIDSEGLVGSLAIASYYSNPPEVLYDDQLKEKVKWARWTNFGWQVEVVDSATYAFFVDIRTKYNSTLVCYATKDHKLKIGMRDDKGWNVVAIGGTDQVGECVALFLPEGVPAVAFQKKDTQDVLVALPTEGGWHTIVVVSEGDVGRGLSATRSSNNVYLSFFSGADGVRLARAWDWEYPFFSVE